ncbi:hypothetical protein F4861DRAFT_541019 [Xylaria intraflava]|nr:hypothetical protein F4861DRAFT_541019 [Xylaria intraflava]
MGPIQTSAQLTHMVQIDPDTERAFNTLKNKVITYNPSQLPGIKIQRPGNISEPWPTIEANMKAIVQQQQDLHDETIREVQEFVAKTIQSTILGPVDGQIRLILQVAFDKFTKVNHNEIQGYVQEIHKLKHEMASMRDNHDTLKRKFDEISHARETEKVVEQHSSEPSQKKSRLLTTHSAFVNLLKDDTPSQTQTYDTIFGDGSGRKSSLNYGTSPDTFIDKSANQDVVTPARPLQANHIYSSTGSIPYKTASSDRTNVNYETPSIPPVGDDHEIPNDLPINTADTTLDNEQIPEDLDPAGLPMADDQPDQQVQRNDRNEHPDQNDLGQQEDAPQRQLRHFDQDLWD